MFTIDTARIDGIEMKYLSFGEGSRALVILPGLSFRPVTEAGEAVAQAYEQFGREYTVWLFDRRSNCPAGYTIRQMAADTAAVMRALGIRSADLFGASQGGMIAQYIAIDCPELVRSLVLASTMCRHTGASRAIVQSWHDLAGADRLQELAEQSAEQMYSEQTLRAYRQLLVSSGTGLSAEETARYILMTESILTFDSSAQISAVTCPTLVIGSRGDRIFGAAASEELARRMNAELFLYGEDYGHCVYDEAPDYKDRLLRFFGKNG